MKKKKIIFFKCLIYNSTSTEEFALKVLNDSKYDDNEYIDKSEIQKSFDEFGYKMNSFNTEIYANSLSNSPNIEGHMLAQNLDDVDSIVVDGLCTKKLIKYYLDSIDDISHIGLSVYAIGIGQTLKIINYILKTYPEKELFLGGYGVSYPHITKLIELGILKKENICFGCGINWIRKKFGLKELDFQEIRIPRIKFTVSLFKKKINMEYLVTQIGCPLGCDFCPTKLLQYNPFCANPKKIIDRINEIRHSYNNDIFLFLCDPNAFYPVHTWRKVFEYFSSDVSNINYDNYVYLFCLSSLNHLQNFNLEHIQQNSFLKFFTINYGIESALEGGYLKNKGVSKKFIDHLRSIGIIPQQNMILGLLHHNKKNIITEIEKNLEYNPAWYSVNTLKPLPRTSIYNTLKNENRLFGNDLPPEFLFQDGFFPFNHKHLGKGFSALKYALMAYHECEKKNKDVFSNFIEIISNVPNLPSLNILTELIDTFKIVSLNIKKLYTSRNFY